MSEISSLSDEQKKAGLKQKSKQNPPKHKDIISERNPRLGDL